MLKKVLIVDDSRTMLLSLRTNLELHRLEVYEASNGKEALQKVRTGLKPDLIITDLNMPQMDGMEFIRQVRPVLKFTPILVLTTESEQAKREEARRLGATGWLVKPVSGNDLISVVRKIVPGV